MANIFTPTKERLSELLLNIDPNSPNAKKLAEIGIDIAKEQAAAKNLSENSPEEEN